MKRLTPIALAFSLLGSCGKHQQNAEFWDWFSENSEEFQDVFASEKRDRKWDAETFKRKNEQAHEEIVDRLKAVNPSFSPSIGDPGDNDSRELIITVFGNVELFDEVDAFVNSAPEIEGWTFTSLMPASLSGPETVYRTGNLEIALSDIRFTSTRNSNSRRHDVTVFLHKGVDSETEHASEFARSLTIGRLGERLAGGILGEVQVQDLEKVPGDALPFLDIKATLEGGAESAGPGER